MSFQYALNASTIKTTPVLEQVAAAAVAGFAGIELWFDSIDDHLRTGGGLIDIRHALDDAGLVVPTTIYLGEWFEADEASYPPILEECKRRMAQAAQIEASYVIAGPPDGEANIELGAKRYRELLEIGVSEGCRPAMEFLGFVEAINTIEDALEVMELSGHPDATTVLDPFHVFRGGGSVESIAKLSAHQIAISHFNDTPADPPREEQHDHHRVMPGDGHLDLQRYITLLHQVGYEGFLSVELFREDLWQRDPREVARLAMDKMQSCVEGG